MKTINRLFILLSLLIVVIGLFLIFNQIIIFHQFLIGVIPDKAIYITGSLFSLFIILILSPFYFLFRYSNIEQVKFEDLQKKEVLQNLKKYLKKNKIIRKEHINLENEENILHCIDILDKKTDNILKSISRKVFLSTAISQYGKLDGLIVLTYNIILIWKIIHIYNNRPSIGSMLKIYSNVFSTVFLSYGMEEADISQYIQPAVDEMIGSIFLGAVPGINNISLFIVNSLLNGTANCFLTIRIGVIAKQNCRIVKECNNEYQYLKRSSSILGIIIKESGSTIISSIKRAFGKSARSGVNKVKNIFRK